jgi:SAM-dependent methyltransferase
MNSAFGLYSQYYDLLNRDKDYDGEAAYVESLIERYSPMTRDVLEFGSGTGKHARLLARSGYRVIGVEQSAEMVAASDSANTEIDHDGSLEFVIGDAREVRLDQRFGAVLALFHVVSYQISDEDVRAVFESAVGHLRDGGIFIFDIWYRPAVLHQKPERRLKKIEDERISVTRIAEPKCDFDRNVVEVGYDVTVVSNANGRVENFSETHPMRFFDTDEIQQFADNGGMSVIHQEEWLTGAEPSEETWGVAFVLRKDSSTC